MNKTTKIGLTTIIGLGLFFGGNYIRPLTKINQKIEYYNIPAEDKTPLDYNKWYTKINVNEKGRAELYLTNDSIYRQINEKGFTGTCGEQVDEFMNEQTEKAKVTYWNLKKKVEDFFKKDTLEIE